MKATDPILDCIWSLSNEYALLPIHRVLLGHDGSMTRSLELATGGKLALRTIKQEVVPCPPDAAQLLETVPGEPANEREILMSNSLDGRPLLHARSYTPLSRLKPHFRADLMRADIPIGRIMQEHRIEARREVLEVGCLTTDPGLEALLEQPGPYLWRTYNIVMEEKPLITITESFAIRLFG